MKRWIIYPILFAGYPVIALLANNISQVPIQAALRSLVVVLGMAVVFWQGMRLVLKNEHRAAMACTWLLILFFTYGHIYHLLEGGESWLQWFGRHRVLLPIWILLAGGVGWLILRRLRAPESWTSPLNIVGLILVLLPGFQVGSYIVRTQETNWQNAHPAPVYTEWVAPVRGAQPDIYYIILDAYSRADVLDERMHFDNQPFLESLEQIGFYVANCSQSNYAQTELSLASSFNMGYLEDIGLPIDPQSTDHILLRRLLRQSAVRTALEQAGYTFVAFETGYLFSQFEDADVYLAPTMDQDGPNDFEILLVKTSAGLVLYDAAKIFHWDVYYEYEKERYYQRVMFSLDQLSRIPDEVPGPKFIFAHIVAPHIPFVFNAEGEQEFAPEPMTDAEYLAGYRNEVTYLNQRVFALAREIQEKSTVPPVIIIQGDHGHDWASSADRMSILNVYYLPGVETNVLYPSITPVNTFRVVFNEYFGGFFALLEDRSYFSFYDTPYQLEFVPNTCQPVP